MTCGSPAWCSGSPGVPPRTTSAPPSTSRSGCCCAEPRADSLTPCRPTPPRSSTSRCLRRSRSGSASRAATRRTRTRADRVHYAASTMKLPLLVAAYRRHERGELDLDAEVPGAQRAPVGVRRLAVLARPGRRPGRRDLGPDRYDGQPARPRPARDRQVRQPRHRPAPRARRHRRGRRRAAGRRLLPRHHAAARASRTRPPAGRGWTTWSPPPTWPGCSAPSPPDGWRRPGRARRSSGCSRAGAPGPGAGRAARRAPTSPTRPAGSTGSPTTSPWCGPSDHPAYVLVALHHRGRRRGDALRG